MTALKWTAAALVAMLAFPAHADVSGPPQRAAAWGLGVRLWLG